MISKLTLSGSKNKKNRIINLYQFFFKVKKILNMKENKTYSNKYLHCRKVWL